MRRVPRRRGAVARDTGEREGGERERRVVVVVKGASRMGGSLGEGRVAGGPQDACSRWLAALPNPHTTHTTTTHNTGGRERLGAPVALRRAPLRRRRRVRADRAAAHRRSALRLPARLRRQQWQRQRQWWQRRQWWKLSGQPARERRRVGARVSQLPLRRRRRDAAALRAPRVRAAGAPAVCGRGGLRRGALDGGCLLRGGGGLCAALAGGERAREGLVGQGLRREQNQ